jgi:hypothetical protein
MCAAWLIGIFGAGIAACLRAVGGESGAPRRTVIEQLGCDDPVIRQRAAEVLAALAPPDPAALPALVKALADEVQQVSLAASTALDAYGDAAVPHLIAALRDEDPDLLGSVLIELRPFGEAAAPALSDLIRFLLRRPAQSPGPKAATLRASVGSTNGT